MAGGAAALLVALGLAALRAAATASSSSSPGLPPAAAAAWLLAWPSPEERQLVLASAVLAMCEVAIVAAVATLFSSFSSPFLTATCTALRLHHGPIGRHDGAPAAEDVRRVRRRCSGAIARVVPNLHVYVPARPLLLGQAPGHPVWPYVGSAAIHAVFYSTVLLVIGALAFRKRDFS